ncbi:uncharacterized protein LACBIDRAFT_331049 [Laccaria bicolor S238N-H82]|uniref:Predicted protein n=1 Tax=Laccaria bicolor (strain S238N-H82 / ATCC MYA-4686) TaxID=486041 RepID=B0DNA0_LACBS|nr:uncharacterized protein LACBIDRAFT_331049 [Laccaria bicolor S238N-H82]EDR03903.1 predicted protein [Laccaria bicolor S238N-H82]|eukprot:XP_001885471.1 predicted protein [Laccaria bicolor S238N-H82]
MSHSYRNDLNFYDQDISEFFENQLPHTDMHYGSEGANDFNIPEQWQVHLPSNTFIRQLNWRDVEDEVDHWRTVAQSEYCEPYFVSLCYSTALETPIEFYVGLSPLSLLTLEKMEERHRQHYILSVEGSFGVQDGPVLQERIPPFRGRILTTYGTFPYHSVVPLPEENHLSIGYLSSDGVTLNSEDKVFIFVGHNSSEFQIQRFHRYVEHMLRGRAYIGSIHADGNRIMQGQEIIPGAPTLPYLKYDLDDIRIFGKAQLLTLPEYQRLKQSPTHLRLTEHVHLDHLPIPAFDPNFNNGQNLGRLLSTGGKGGQASACQIKILLDYAPGTAKQLDDLDIFIQSLVLTRIPLNYTPATHAGTSHTLSTEMHAAFKSIWEEGKRLYPPKYPLEDYMYETPVAPPQDYIKLLHVCLSFLYNAISKKVDGIVHTAVAEFLGNLHLGDDEAGGLSTMLDEPFQHQLLFMMVQNLICKPTLNSVSNSKSSRLGTVRSEILIARKSLIGVPNEIIANVLAKIYRMGAMELKIHPIDLRKESDVFQTMVSRMDAIERPHYKHTSNSFKSMKFELLQIT